VLRRSRRVRQYDVVLLSFHFLGQLLLEHPFLAAVILILLTGALRAGLSASKIASWKSPCLCGPHLHNKIPLLRVRCGTTEEATSQLLAESARTL
jgi:hypothetical protein